jgi:hypothetical protein
MLGKIIFKLWFITLCFFIPLLINVQALPVTIDIAATTEDKEAVRVSGQVTDFTLEPGEVDQPLVFKDPANEQTVLFDLTEGGAIVSLKYRNVEYIWGYNGGGLLQMSFHLFRNDGMLT